MLFCPAGIFGTSLHFHCRHGQTMLFLCCHIWADILHVDDFENNFEIPLHFCCSHCQTVLFVLLYLGFVLSCLG